MAISHGIGTGTWPRGIARERVYKTFRSIADPFYPLAEQLSWRAETLTQTFPRNRLETHQSKKSPPTPYGVSGGCRERQDMT